MHQKHFKLVHFSWITCQIKLNILWVDEKKIIDSQGGILRMFWSWSLIAFLWNWFTATSSCLHHQGIAANCDTNASPYSVWVMVWATSYLRLKAFFSINETKIIPVESETCEQFSKNSHSHNQCRPRTLCGPKQNLFYLSPDCYSNRQVL